MLSAQRNQKTTATNYPVAIKQLAGTVRIFEGKKG